MPSRTSILWTVLPPSTIGTSDHSTPVSTTTCPCREQQPIAQKWSGPPHSAAGYSRSGRKCHRATVRAAARAGTLQPVTPIRPNAVDEAFRPKRHWRQSLQVASQSVAWTHITCGTGRTLRGFASDKGRIMKHALTQTDSHRWPEEAVRVCRHHPFF